MSKIIITCLFFLCAYVDSNAQMDISTLSKKFDSYKSVWGKTEIHLTLNQDKFSPGDTVWLKAYFLKEDMTRVVGKQLLDINLVDSEGKSKLHFLISVKDGVGQNQFVIPNTLTAGFYLVTAYSSWMQNFDPFPIFKKSIEVVTGNSIVKKEKTIIRSYAEGGHLIGGIPNKIGIISNRINTPIQIINSSNFEMGRTITDQNGLGSILFVPSKEAIYFAKIEGDTTRAILSPVEKEGYGISLSPVEKGEGYVMILITPSSISSVQEELFFIASAKGKIYYTTSIIPATDERVNLKLPNEKLPTGIVNLSVITRAGITVASRDFFIPDENTIQVKIETPKNHYQTREKVQLEVIISDQNGRSVEGEFSIRVLNAALFDTEKKKSLADNLMTLNGEGLNTDQSDTSWVASLDNYLICNTTDLPWKEIIHGNYAKPRFPFTAAIQKNGFAYVGDTQESTPNSTQVMFYLPKNIMHYQVLVQEKGKISLAIPDIYGQDEFFYLAESKGEKISNLKIKWEDTSIQLPHAQLSSETKNADAYSLSSIKRNLIDQSFSLYTSSKVEPVIVQMTDFENEVDGADITINVQDYITFSSMEELVKEISSSLYHRKRGDGGIVRVKLIPPMIANDDPLYIIDGTPTKDTDFFLSLKPSEILTLKVVKNPKKLLPLGLMGKNGIVLVKTKQGNTRKPIESSMSIEGLNKPLTFSNHNYSSGSYLLKPDFRSTIYWNSSIQTDSNGRAMLEFYTSDDIGKMNIRIDGFTKEGKPFSEFKNIEVKLGTGN